MRNTHLIFIVIVGLVTPYSAFGQSASLTTKTLSWYAKQSVEKTSGNDIGSGCIIVTKQTNSIDFITGRGQTMSFKIESVEGIWEDEVQDGKLTYRIRYLNDIPGVVILERKAGIVMGWIDFTESNADGMSLEFTISSISEE